MLKMQLYILNCIIINKTFVIKYHIHFYSILGELNADLKSIRDVFKKRFSLLYNDIYK